MNKAVLKVNSEEVKKALHVIIDAYEADKTLYFFGNGGSAAVASHFANEYAKCCIAPGKKLMKAISLTDNVALFTAWANDEGYESIFLGQLKNFLEYGDVVIGISGSGNSPNVVNACAFAKERGAKVIGMTGFSGGKLRELADVQIHVPETHYGRIEDVHMMVGHMMGDYIRTQVLGKEFKPDWQAQRKAVFDEKKK